MKQFFARLTGPLPSKCILTYTHSFAEPSRSFRQKTLSADRSHQQGAHLTKSKHLGPWWLALANQRLASGSLAAAFGLGFSRLQKPIPASSRNQDYQNYSWNNVMIISVQGTIYCTVLCIYTAYVWWFKISNFPKTSVNKKFSSASSEKFARGLMLDPWRPSQLKILTWTFRSSTMRIYAYIIYWGCLTQNASPGKKVILFTFLVAFANVFRL